MQEGACGEKKIINSEGSLMCRDAKQSYCYHTEMNILLYRTVAIKNVLLDLFHL